MIRIRETLEPENILLSLSAESRDEAIRRVAESLRSDTRVTHWQDFFRALTERDTRAKVNLHYGLALPHIRTSAVTAMVMAFGRLSQPVQETDGPLHFVIVVGIPGAMDAEYLRLVGALMRVFRSDKLRQELSNAQSPAQIIDIFEKGEIELVA